MDLQILCFVHRQPSTFGKSQDTHWWCLVWNISVHLSEQVCLFISPLEVGTGFSFTEDDRGFAQNQDDVGRDLYR